MTSRSAPAEAIDHGITALYRAGARPALVDVPELTFLVVDGHGDPNSSERYQLGVQALFAVSYGVKFAIKKVGGPDYKVGPLEGLWWAADMTTFTTVGARSDWNWTSMIRQPDEATGDLLAMVGAKVAADKGLPLAGELRRWTFTEGRAAQILHQGPFSDERPTIARLHVFIADGGYWFDGRVHKHHEIYLSDIRRADPQKWRTIIRQPVTTDE